MAAAEVVDRLFGQLPPRAALREAIDTGGFTALPAPALQPAMFDALREEAREQRVQAWDKASDGAPGANARRADLGPVARSFLTHPETAALLHEAFGVEVEPSYEATCFTYYEAEGDFLDTHCDRPESCELTLIAYLEATWPDAAEPGPGLALEVYGPDGSRDDQQLLATRTNTVVLGRGAHWPHGRPPLREGERIVALTACYRPRMRELRGALSRGPFRGDTRPQEAGRARHLVSEGFDLYGHGLGDGAAARERFEAGLAADPDYDMAWSGIGFVSWLEGSFEASYQAFVQAARREPYNVAHWANIGGQLRELGKLEEAQNAFSVALKLNPDYAPAWNEWANVLQDAGRFDDALPYYHRSLALDPSRAVVHHNLGVCYGRLGEKDLARDGFLSALARDPNYFHAQEELGVLDLEAGEIERGRDWLARAGTPRAQEIAALHGVELEFT